MPKITPQAARRELIARGETGIIVTVLCETSGVVVLAKDAKMAGRLQTAIGRQEEREQQQHQRDRERRGEAHDRIAPKALARGAEDVTESPHAA